MQKNALFYGDNLEVLRNKIQERSIDLCYIDPPFNSKRTYFQIYNNIGGEDRAQAQAFVDTWSWEDRANVGHSEILDNAQGRFSSKLVDLIKGLTPVLGKSGLLAYLVSMSMRITEINRVLKESGSFYLHCDPTASHYLKIICDAIFLGSGGTFRNEIIWHYLKWSISQRQFVSNHDVVLFYSKSNSADRVFNTLFVERSPATLRRFGNARIVSSFGSNGVRQPSQTEGKSAGVAMDDVWDISRVPPIKQLYPTEKPAALLERIIKASTNPGDTILDAYCGCGTTVITAQSLDRKWIGIDITYQSISLILRRLEQSLGTEAMKSITTNGIPKDIASAKALANNKDDRLRKEFEKWAALTYTKNRAIINEKRGADAGVDARAYFKTGKDDNDKIIFQVKSGGVDRGDIAKLRGDMARECAAMACFITLEEPSGPMKQEAKAVGHYVHADMARNYDRISIVTVRDIVENNCRLEIPMSLDVIASVQRASSHLRQPELL